MNISDILKPNTLKLNLTAKDKEGVIDEMLDILVKAKKLNSKYKKKVKKALMDREKLGSTGVGQNIGIPHARDDSVKKIVSCCALSKAGVDFDALDGEPVNVFFMILAPKNVTGEHLKALARISRLMRGKFFRLSLMRCKTPQELLAVLKREEKELK